MNDRKKLLVSLTTVIQVLEDIGCAGVFNEIELKDGTKEKIDCVEEIIKYIDDDLSINPYEFKDLKIGMWVYDISRDFCYKVYKIREDKTISFLLDIGFGYIETFVANFEEGRFYPLTKAMEE